MKLSLVIPCYNEAPNLPALINRCELLVSSINAEVVIVDNGSTDETPVILACEANQKTNIKFLRVEENQGYGHGILEGLKSCRGDVIGWTHADLQTDPLDVMDAMKVFEKKSNKSLFLKGRRYGRPIADVAFTIGMSFFETLILRKLMWDINAQPTLFDRNFFYQWTSPPKDFSLDLYAYYSAKRNNLIVRRIPVKFGDRLHGSSHWNINWAEKFKFIKRTMAYSFRLKRNL